MKKRCLGVLLALAITLAQMPTAMASIEVVISGQTIKEKEGAEGRNTISGEFRPGGQNSESARKNGNFTVKVGKPSDSGATEETSSGDDTEQWIPVGGQPNRIGSLHAGVLFFAEKLLFANYKNSRLDVCTILNMLD